MTVDIQSILDLIKNFLSVSLPLSLLFIISARLISIGQSLISGKEVDL